tara:strand:+ start:1544 stop:2320 length:777 start_codon:yes stop_codon:yes gene_type:complete
MRRKETRILFENWNRYLLKEATAARVMNMIDDLEKFNSKITIEEPKKDAITIRYKPTKSGRLRGSIQCSASGVLGMNKQTNLGIGKGEVNSPWYVTLTSTTTDGMGPLLYEVLMEYISHSSIKNSALKPDYSSVSDDARSVWEKFDKRPDSDIRKIQLDVDIDTVDLFKRRGDNIEQITPVPPADNIKDDTRQFSAIYDKGSDDWSSSSLSRAYRKDNHDLITSLVRRNLIEMPDYASKLFDEDRFGDIEDGEGWDFI